MNENYRGSIAVLGQGYVGLPLALAAREAGWNVVGLDKNLSLVRQLNRGVSHVEDVSSEDLRRAMDGGMRIESNMELIGEVNIVVICVPTPIDSLGQPDLQYLDSAIESIAMFAKSGTLVINESTSFPGTLRDYIEPRVSEKSPEIDLEFAISPERIDPGSRKWNYKNTPRLVSGLTESSKTRVHKFYSTFCDVVIPVSSPEVAELAKLLENSFRLVNIALVNELVPIAKAFGANIFDVVDAASTKPYGFMKFEPGIGVGGHCIPVDPIYLSWAARNKGLSVNLIDISQDINKQMPIYVYELIENCNIETNARILLVGLSYKRGVQDLRESPSIELLGKLESKFKDVQWWDPLIQQWKGKERSKLESPFDIVVITQRVDDSKIVKIASESKYIIDCTGQFRNSNNSGAF